MNLFLIDEEETGWDESIKAKIHRNYDMGMQSALHRGYIMLSKTVYKSRLASRKNGVKSEITGLHMTLIKSIEIVLVL